MRAANARNEALERQTIALRVNEADEQDMARVLTNALTAATDALDRCALAVPMGRNPRFGPAASVAAPLQTPSLERL